MSRSRHELRDWQIDRNYPFQVVLLAVPCVTSSTMSCFYPANWDAAPRL